MRKDPVKTIVKIVLLTLNEEGIHWRVLSKGVIGSEFDCHKVTGGIGENGLKTSKGRCRDTVRAAQVTALFIFCKLPVFLSLQILF
jgi:hypothetical protein